MKCCFILLLFTLTAVFYLTMFFSKVSFYFIIPIIKSWSVKQAVNWLLLKSVFCLYLYSYNDFMQGKKEYVVVDYLFYLYTSFHISQNKNI